MVDSMIEIRETDAFAEWISNLRDRNAQAVIAARLARMEVGNFGDSRSVGGRVSELRINVGPGYRAYYTRHGAQVVFMLGGGDKSSQARDIQKAQKLAEAMDRWL